MVNESIRENELPKWIFILGCFLVVFGGVSGVLGIVNPILFFNDFPSIESWRDVSFITNSWGIRNLAMAVALIIALWLKTPSVIVAVFSMRFFNELGDLINVLISGHGSFGVPLMFLLIGWVLFFLIPEALAVRWGFSKYKSH